MLYTYEHKKIKRIVFIGIIFILTLFIGVRFLKVYFINKPFVESMTYDKTLGKAKYYSKESGYVFKYLDASFFNMDCFASVCAEEDVKSYMDSEGNIFTDGMQIILFIWPIENKYGLDFYQCDSEGEIKEQFYIDENMNYIPDNGDEKYNQYINSLLDEYEQDIKNLLKEAHNKWKL